MSARLEVEALAVDVTADEGRVRVVDDVSFTVEPGETVALVGESGSGKSLTIRAVLGLLPHGVEAAGTIRWAGRDLARISPRERRALLGTALAYVPQEPLLDPVMRVGRQIVEALRVHGVARGEARARAVALLEDVGIADAPRRVRAYPHELSGGMRQRAMLALALANAPELIVADEPTTALDVITQAQILGELAAARAEAGRSLLLVTHDLGVVAGVADRVLVMYAGRIVESRSADAAFGDPRHPYTAALLDAIPRAEDRRGALPTLPGAPPEPGGHPSGCAFRTRCAFARDRCADSVPPLVAVDGGGEAACLRVDEVAPALRERVRR